MEHLNELCVQLWLWCLSKEPVLGDPVTLFIKEGAATEKAVSESAGVYLPLLSLSAATFEQFLALCHPWTSFWRSVNCPHPDPRACMKTCV